MLLVGLTGNIASGKSSVAELLARKGATIIDADELARRAVEPGTAALEAIRQRWGDTVVVNGELDRAALRRIVFANLEEREALNQIVHPRVEAMRAEAIAAARSRGDRIVVCDIPLLYEKDLAGQFDRVILVDAPRTLRLQRLTRERDLPRAEAEAMLDAQMAADAKRSRADYVIDSVGTHAQLEQRVNDIWRSLQRDAEKAAS